MIGSSNRGGRRVRKRTFDQAGLGENSTPASAKNTFSEPNAVPSREDHRSNSVSYRTEATPSHSAWLADDYSTIQPGEVNSPTPGIMLDPALQAADTNARELLVGRNSSAGSENIAFNDLQNPSDALGILAQIASNGESSHITNMIFVGTRH